MLRILFSGLLLVVLSMGSTSIQLIAQQPSETQETIESVGERIPLSTEDAALKGVMILRVSEHYLEELFARDIDKETQVNRVVLGTRAHGTAHTTGRADVDTKPDVDDAAFYVRIYGSTTSQTIGRNGPAIIRSSSVTDWTCQKIVRFTGERFMSGLATIESKTRITPLGVDTNLRGLRGRIVKRVGTRRVRECNGQAERITGRNTEKKVLADVDRIVDQRIETLNQRVRSRPLMSLLLPRLDDMGITFSSSSKCINVSFAGGESSPLAKVCPVQGLDPSDTELWFQTALIAKPEDGGISEMIDDGGAWLSKMLPDLELPGIDVTGDQGLIPINVEVVDGWIVVRSQAPAMKSAQADSHLKSNRN